MIFAADILKLPPSPVKPTEYLVVVAMMGEENLTRILLGMKLQKTKVWVGTDIYDQLRPPFVVLEER